MKFKITLLSLVIFFHFVSIGQNNNARTVKQLVNNAATTYADSLKGFDLKDGYEHAAHLGKNALETNNFINQAKRTYIDRKYNLDRPHIPVYGKGAPNSVTALNCPVDNYDFEQGSVAGWTMSGNYGLMSAGTDPYGGFPNVCPLTPGSTSLKLSSDLASGCCNSSATKSIAVPAAGTTFFTFYFALAVFSYPHTAADAGKFSVNFYDATGALIPCPQFLCYHSTDNGDVGVSNFSTTPGPAVSYNPSSVGDQSYNSSATYAPWQAVTADLTPYAGTTISVVFDVKWCVYNVDWLYALIDASCPLNYTPPPSSCVTIPSNLCGPPNMQSYSWHTPSGGTGTAPCISATTAGIYTVTCVPALDCGSASFTYTYNVQPIPTAGFTSSLPACSSNLTATDNSTLNGATVASYSWDYGDAATGTGNPGTHTYASTPGTYTVTETITTTQGCTATVNNPVTITNPLTVNVNSPTICSGVSAVLTASGGATAYSWSPPTNLSATTGTNVTASPPATTVYTVTGTNGTCSNTATSTVTIAPGLIVTATGGTVCTGATINLTSTAGGATYAWTGPGAFSSAVQNPSIANATVPMSGTYSVTITDAGGCVGTTTANVTVSATPVVVVTGNTVCANGTINLTSPAGGITYAWTGPSAYSSAAQNPSITNATAAMTGTYSLTMTNPGGCVGTGTAVATVNPLPVVTVSGSTVCANATINLTSTGGTTYTWTGPGAYASAAQNPSITNATAAMSGTYSVTVTDANGCVNGNSTNVTVNPLPIVTVSGSTVCTGATINLTSTGGTTYAWTGPGAYSSNAQNPTILNGLPSMSGIYSVTVTDANGCVSGNSTNVTVNSSLLVTAASNAPCAGLTLNLTSTGGVTWAWSGPAAFASALQNPSIPNATVGLNGTYSITATDANGCVGTATVNITVNPLPNPTASSNTPLCVNQTLNLTGGGGTGYAWSGPNGFVSAAQNPSTASVTILDAGVYTLVATDANGCQAAITTNVVVNPLPVVTVSGSTVCLNATINLSSGGATTYTWTGPGAFSSNAQNPSIANATAGMTGTYSVTATDVNGCVSGNSTNVTINSLPIVTANTNAPCTGFALNLTSTGGTSWSWSGPGAFSSALQNPSIPNATIGLNGAYSVIATDANGCVGSATVNITVNPLPVLTIGSNSPVCVNQTLNLTASGGVSYAWSGPNAFTSVTQNPSITGTTAAANGMYSVVVTDLNGCVNSATINAVINPLPIVIVSGATVCVNATINLGATGGVSYSWSGPPAFTSNLQNPAISNADPTMSGSYVVTVTDGNGCVSANVAQVTVNNLPVVTANSSVICIGQQTTLTATGAVTYAWSPVTGLSASTGTTVSASPASTSPYTVIGTDVNGCQSSGTLTVTVNPLPLVSVSPVTSSGCAPVCITFSNTAAGTGTCSWNLGDGTTSTSCSPSHCYTGQGTFNASLTLTDINGCVNTSTATVIVYPVPVADFYGSPQPTTILEPNIQFTNASSGAVIILNSWNFGDPNNTTSTLANPAFIYQAVGSYPVSLVVSSDHGCIDSITKIIKIDDEYSLYVPNAFSPNGDGVNDMFFAKGEGIKDFKLYIFDRWGQQVFFSDDIYKGWDGRFQSKGTEIVQEDVYVWKIECKTPKGEAKMLKGHVSLIK
jgi:gliding motility-associated-like protein